MHEKVKMKVPILYYNEAEEGRELESIDVFPYIEVQKDEEFPKALFVQEWRETGETEYTNDGEMPIVERDIKLFINCDVLEKLLDENTFAKVRAGAGLPLRKKKG